MHALLVVTALLGQLTVYDRGTKQGQATQVNCVGTGVSCSSSQGRWELRVSASSDGGSGSSGVSSVTASSPLASSGGAAPNISLTGTVSQARGGTGASALTCSAGQALTSNGSAYSCTSTIAASTAAALASNPADCGSHTYANAIAANGDLTCSSVALATDVSGTLPEASGGTGAGSLSCSSGQALTSNGTTYSCTSTIVASSGTATTAAALASNPVDCSSGQYANAIAANGDLTCSAVATSQLSGTITNAQLANSYSGVGTCTNQFARVLSANAAPTCATVSLTADVSGTLPQANGGTGAGALSCASKTALTSNGTAFSCTSALAGGNPSEVQYNNSGALGGVSNLTSNGVVPIIGNDAGTVANTTDGMALYAVRDCDWSELREIGPKGGEAALAESAHDVPWVLLKPSGTSNMSCVGTGCNAGTSTSTGTITAPAQTLGGDDWEWRFRTQEQTAASTNSSAYITGTGNSNNLGAWNTTKGLKFWSQFSVPKVNANARVFVGVRDPVSTMMPNSDPSSYLESAGCSLDSAQTTLRLLTSSPDGGAFTTDCGASFAVRDAGTAFTCRFLIHPGGGSICMSLTKESTGETCMVRRTAGIPSAGYPLTFLSGTNSGATAAATNIESTGIYVRAASR